MAGTKKGKEEEERKKEKKMNEKENRSIKSPRASPQNPLRPLPSSPLASPRSSFALHRARSRHSSSSSQLSSRLHDESSSLLPLCALILVCQDGQGHEVSTSKAAFSFSRVLNLAEPAFL